MNGIHSIPDAAVVEAAAWTQWRARDSATGPVSVGKDLARFEESPQTTVAFLSFLKKGYGNGGDKAAIAASTGRS